MANAKNAIYMELAKRRTALGNTETGLKELASDLLHATGEKPVKLAEGTFLSVGTICRVMDCPDDYKPNSDTVERIYKYCNQKITSEYCKIKSQYQNKPKVEI